MDIRMNKWRSICFLLLSILFFPAVTYAAAPDRMHATLCVDPDWYPFEALDAKNQHIGIAADLIRLIVKRSNVDLQIVKTKDWEESMAFVKQGRCDLLSLLNKTPERDKWLLFTSPYLIDSNALITRHDSSDIIDLTAKTVALPEGTAVEEKLKTDYPNVHIIHAASEKEAFRMVENRDVDVTLRSKLMAQYTITHDGWFNLKIAGEMPSYENLLRIGVNKTKPELRDRLDIGVAALTDNEVNQVINKYIPVIVNQTNYRLILSIIGGSLTLLTLILLWARQLRLLNIKLAESQAELNKELTARIKYQVLLDETKERYRKLIETAQEGIVVIQHGKVVFSNPNIEKMLGYASEQLKTITLDQLLAPEDAAVGMQHHHERLNGINSHQRYNIRLQHQSGVQIIGEVSGTVIDWDGEPAVLNFISDVTQRMKNEQQIQFIAQHDQLTNLPNRLLLEDRLNQGIMHADRHQDRLAVLFIDLDRFKPVNDLYGHEMGDWLLKHVAERLKQSVRQSDTVVRWGGDEFIILLPSVITESQIKAICQKIMHHLQQPFITATGIELAMSCSIGVAVYPDHGLTASELLHVSDKSMYQAKRSHVEKINFLFPLSDGREINALRLNWKEEFLSGHSGIDKEHKDIFLLANQLLKALSHQVDVVQLRHLLDRLFKHLQTHFQHEESVLEKIAYPQFSRHQHQHQQLIAEAVELLGEFDNGNIEIQTLIRFVVIELIYKHVVMDDSEWFPFHNGKIQLQAIVHDKIEIK
jgi:diguanylate cyclase (GGDEF)-like protein/hemerythrin-like metal-binding protein/PAS domain S-box-containing protein